jgi:hypothetical protein
MRSWKADFTRLQSDAALELSRSGLETRLGPESLAVNYGYVDSVALPDSLSRLKGRLTGHDGLPALQLNELFAFELWLQAFFTSGPSRALRTGLLDKGISYNSNG